MNIKKEVPDKIVEHAKSELPNDACGYLAGTADIITLFYAMTNVDHSPEHFSFDPREQFEVMKDTRIKDIQIPANYHSHPSTPSRPSQEDIRLAFDPGLVMSLFRLHLKYLW